MVPKYLLDTNICIYIRQRRPPELLERFKRLAIGEAALSIITFGELVFGAAKSSDAASAMGKLDELASFLTVLPLPLDAARAYGSIRAELEARGETIGNNDLWIAAHARSEHFVLVTNNEREFRRIDDLEIENWVQARSGS